MDFIVTAYQDRLHRVTAIDDDVDDVVLTELFNEKHFRRRT